MDFEHMNFDIPFLLGPERAEGTLEWLGVIMRTNVDSEIIRREQKTSELIVSWICYIESLETFPPMILNFIKCKLNSFCLNLNDNP